LIDNILIRKHLFISTIKKKHSSIKQTQVFGINESYFDLISKKDFVFFIFASNMKLTASICTYNREKYLPQIFESIRNQTLSKDQFEVVLINNNSPGNTKDLCDAFRENNLDIDFNYFEEFQQGLSYARNRSIDEAKGEIITFLDDDAFIDSRYFEILVREFEENKDVNALGGKILLHYEDGIPSWENKYLNSILGYFNMGDEEKFLKLPQYPRGSNMAFRMSLFKEIGQFDTNFGRTGGNMMGGEEKELFNRIYKSGALVKYVPSAVVYHCVPIERTTVSFVKTQAIGVGYSQQLSSKKEGVLGYIKALVLEKMKWIASLGLSLGYLLQGKLGRSKMLIRFRYWVTLGLLTKNPKKYL
jgi:glycosyltransferase involved in cell wall biosynthesis